MAGRRTEDESDYRASEFWQEEEFSGTAITLKQAIRWTLPFALLFAGVFFVFWWSGSAVRFSASRVDGTTAATYRVFGVVRDAQTGNPIPWARLEDVPLVRAALHGASAGVTGEYEMLTIAEPHEVLVSAYGYRPTRFRVGKLWYLWWPSGSENRDVSLTPESRHD